MRERGRDTEREREREREGYRGVNVKQQFSVVITFPERVWSPSPSESKQHVCTCHSAVLP